VVRASIGVERLGHPIGADFVGLSVEVSALPAVARDATRGNLVALLRSIGPGLIRFGGSSADLSTAFSASGPVSTPWATTTITPQDFDRIRTLLRRAGWRAILTVPLAHYDPSAAAREVAAAARRLGPWLAAVEIGNEPDAFWLVGLRPFAWDYGRYRAELRAYRRAIARRAVVPILGPDTAGMGWLSSFARDERPAVLTAHYYPLSACAPPTPSLDRLLSPALFRRQQRTLRRIATIARAGGAPARLDETNSVGCAGQTGVSDTYGASLWALRYMIQAVRSGIRGLNFHTLLDTCGGYSPICADSSADYAAGRLRPMPEWYALLLFSRLTGERAARVSLAGRPPGLTVDAFAGTSRVDVIVVNSGDRKRSLTLRPTARFDSTEVLRLTAPALEASSGVELGGRAVSPANLRVTRRIARGLRVSVAAASAAVVTLYRL
jgi:hypothetical protein